MNQNYKYNGKELQSEFGLGWSDYGARMYDNQLGRFFNLDRFSEDYYDYTPYHYTLNNPILFVDVNGDSTIVNNVHNPNANSINTGFKTFAREVATNLLLPILKTIKEIGGSLDGNIPMPDSVPEEKNNEIANKHLNVTTIAEKGPVGNTSSLPRSNPEAEQITVNMDFVNSLFTAMSKSSFKVGSPQKNPKGTNGNRGFNDFAKEKAVNDNFGATQKAVDQFGGADTNGESTIKYDTLGEFSTLWVRGTAIPKNNFVVRRNQKTKKIDTVRTFGPQ